MTSSEPNALILNSFLLTIKQAIKEKKINTESPIAIITKAMELLEHVNGMSGKDKKMYIIQAIEIIAKGDDGVFGTADDLLPERTVRALAMFVEQDVIGDTIQLITDATKGQLDINKAQSIGLKLFALFGSCCRKP